MHREVPLISVSVAQTPTYAASHRGLRGYMVYVMCQFTTQLSLILIVRDGQAELTRVAWLHTEMVC